jgi:hypothetical protein
LCLRLDPTLFGAIFVVIAVVVAVTPLAMGHDRPERRRLIVSVERDRIELLVGYEVRPGSLASELRATIDHDRDGRASSAWERIAEAQVLLPRVRRGIELFVGGQPRALRVNDFRFRDGSTEGRSRGLEGLVRLDGGPAFGGDGESMVEIRFRGPEPALTVELQGGEGVELTSTPTTHRTTAGAAVPVVGPFLLRVGEQAPFRFAPIESNPTEDP